MKNSLAGSFGGYDNIAEIGELYDHVPAYVTRSDVAFFLDAARALPGTGKVLELGCGTGRVLIPIARLARSIVGLDRSGRMLAACKDNLAREPSAVQQWVRLYQGDMRDFDLGEAFSLIIAPFRPFQHLVATEDQIRCLRAVHQHLEPGGRLIFDVFCPNLRLLADNEQTEETEDTPETALPDGRQFRRTSRVAAVHQVEQWSEIEIIYYVKDTEGRISRLVQSFPMRWYFRYEVEHLLARCGFVLRAVYGNYDYSALVDGSPEMIFIAERT